jgi:hypothetical protein
MVNISRALDTTATKHFSTKPKTCVGVPQYNHSGRQSLNVNTTAGDDALVSVSFGKYSYRYIEVSRCDAVASYAMACR